MNNQTFIIVIVSLILCILLVSNWGHPIFEIQQYHNCSCPQNNNLFYYYQLNKSFTYNITGEYNKFNNIRTVNCSIISKCCYENQRNCNLNCLYV